MSKIWPILLATVFISGVFLFRARQQSEEIKVSPAPNSSQANNSDELGYMVEIVAQNLFVPWSIVFTNQNRMLVSQRDGQIREINNLQLTVQPLYIFRETTAVGEAGLMGMAKDPDYEVNKLLYAIVTYRQNSRLVNKVVRLKDMGVRLEPELTIFDNIPAASNHAGGRIKFGPDKKLYITTGDTTVRNLAQDITSLAGKILRINPDGSIPQDNPFSGSAVFSYGHRNSQGFDWHPLSNLLYATEHGPSGFDGPGGGDEINLIQGGLNYGWPIVSHERNQEGMVFPLTTYTPAVAPADAIFYNSDILPQFKGSFLFTALIGEGIYQVNFAPGDPKKIIGSNKLADIKMGRIREIVTGPDGFIYFAISNRDGRGEIQNGDDKIYRLVPDRR